MHAWDEPVETVLRLAPAAGVPLLIPRLGEPVEPSRADGVDPWWRSVASGRAPEPDVQAASSGAEAPARWLAD
jgi:hypothetical protein